MQLAPSKEINDPSEAVILEGKVEKNKNEFISDSNNNDWI